MLESSLQSRAAAYLKLIKADIWVVPSKMLDAIQSWLISAYAAEVANMTNYELILDTDGIKEAERLADEVNAMILGLHSVLDAMQLNETKEIPIKFFYHDRFGWYETTVYTIRRLDKDSFDLSIKGDGKSIFTDPLMSKNELIDAVSDSVQDLLEKIHHGIETTPLIDHKILYNATRKLKGDKTGGNQSVATSIDIDLTNWPYLDRIAVNHKKFLSDNLEDNTDEKNKLLMDIANLNDLGDYAGPFLFKDARNYSYTFNIMVDTKGGFNIEFDSASGEKQVRVYKNRAALEKFIDKSFITPLDNYVRSAGDAASMAQYMENEYPAISKIRVVFENMDQNKYGGLWDPTNFTLYVRPKYPDPIQASKASGKSASELFEQSVQDMRSTTRHELQHFSQSLAAILTTGRRDKIYGLPSRRDAPFESGQYGTSGVAKDQDKTRPLSSYEIKEDPSYGLSSGKTPSDKETIMLQHQFRDVEYQTRLADEIDKFKNTENKLPKSLRNRAIKIWTGELDEPLVPFADGKTWNEFRAKNNVGGQFILDFLENHKLNVKNFENWVKNHAKGTTKYSVDSEKQQQEMYLLQRLNRLIYPATFFKSLKQVALSGDKDVGDSRWARAVGSFIKEVS